VQQVPLLVHSGYRVILPDLYGHGQSQAADHVTTVDELAKGILAVLDNLGVDRATFCGLSLGGMVAQQIALENPERVRALIIVDSLAARPGLDGAISNWIALFEQPDGPRKRLKATWPNLVNDQFAKSDAGRAAFATWQHVLGSIPGSSLANVAKGMAQFDVRQRLPMIGSPTLVIYGDQDKLVNPDQSREIAQGIPGAQLRSIPHAGHIPCLDSPSHFNLLLLEFLNSQPA